MKSRFLTSITVALTLLLGLVSSNLMAQISNASTVVFKVKAYTLTGSAISDYRTSSANEDTVGHKFDLLVGFETDAQLLSTGVNYSISLPKGSVTTLADLQNSGVKITYKTSAGAPTGSFFYASASNISITNDNPLASYDETKTPTVVIHDANTYTDRKYVQVELIKGVSYGKKVLRANSWVHNNAGRMVFGLNHGSTTLQNGNFVDSTNFYLRNDKAESVIYNTTVTAVADGQKFPGADSVIIADRFGNFVPDFFSGSAAGTTDTLYIYTDANMGNFAIAPDKGSLANAWKLSGSPATPTISATSEIIRYSSASNSDTVALMGDGGGNSYIYKSNWSKSDFDGSGDPAGDLTLFNKVTSAVNSDSTYVIMYLGSVGHGGKRASAGLSFTKATGVSSATFKFRVAGKTTQDNTTALLGETPDRVTTVTRELLTSTAGNTIGNISISLASGEITSKTSMNAYYNGANNFGAITVTLKNRFGDLYSNGNTLDGTTIERVIVELKGVNLAWASNGNLNSTGITYDSELTTALNSTSTVGSYTRPVSHLYDSNKLDVTAAGGGDYVKNTITVNASSQFTISPTYLGRSTHGYTKGIAIIVRSASNAAADTAFITVEPGYVRAWDVSTLQANLANATVIKGAAINAELPIFALDTTYNYVSNLKLGDNTATTGLDALTLTGTAQTYKSIQLLLDGNELAATSTALTLDSTGMGQAASFLTGTNGNLYKRMVFDIDPYAGGKFRADSSRLNFGAVGASKLYLRLDTTGIRRVSVKWDAAQSNLGYLPNIKTQDVGLFNIQSNSLIDSLINISANLSTNGDTAGGVVNRIIRFKAAAGNILNPDKGGDTSRVFIRFLDLPAGAGLPATLTASNFKVSVDTALSTNWFDALAVGGDNDSVAIKVPMLVDPSVNFVYIKIIGFTNPTKSDSTYRVQVATGMSPVWNTPSNGVGYTPGDGTYAKFELLNVRTPLLSNPKYFSVVASQPDTTLKAGVEAQFKLLLGDKFGNVVNQNKGSTSPNNIIVLGDTSVAGNSLSAVQNYDGVLKSITSGRGLSKADTIAVDIDSLPAQNRWSVVDSILVTPAAVGSYYLVFADSNNTTIRDSVMVTVSGAATSGSIAVVKPLGKQTISKGATCDSALTVTLRDTYGNVLAGSNVTYAVIYGSGTFVDSMGTTPAVPNDTIAVKTNASGQASVKLKAATTGDSIAVAVYDAGNSQVARKYFYFNTTAASNLGPTAITFVTVPDSVSPDTASVKSVAVKVTDRDGVKKVKLVASTFTLTLGTDNKFAKSATSVDTTVWDSTMKTTKPDSINVTLSLSKKAVGSLVEYAVTAYDANDTVTVSATKSFIVGAKRGKSNLTTTAVNVADIMRLVYLVLGYATPGTIDWFGLDLNQDGAFTGDADLTTILNIWKGVSTLASSTEQKEVTAKAALSFKEIDKTNASLSINLENRGELNYAEFMVKYDATKYSFGEVSRTERIDQNVQVMFNNRKEEGILHIIVLNIQGRSIVSGSGAVLNVPVQALNGKFDGTGEISLLSAGFEQNVKSELSKEVLSPKAALPKAFALGQNYPNPFNPSTTIAYDIPEGKEVQVRLNIYNVRGQLVRTLVDEVKSEGAYLIQWDGSSNNGQKVSSGVYFYRLVAGEFNQTRKMVILK